MAAPNLRPQKAISLSTEISGDVQNEIKVFKEWMAQKRYSTNTIATYESMLLVFFRFHFPKTWGDITEQDLLAFNTEYIIANGFSYIYQNQAINALKLFYRRLGNGTLLPENMERPKKSKKLPVVLSIDEVKTLLGNIPNLKHKTLLSLLYSCGLRIGEAIHLKLRHMDMDRRFMHIKSGKGAKDRYVPISGQMTVLLKRYQLAYQPKEYVFEGQQGGTYTAVSARQVLKRALKKPASKKRLPCIR